MDQHVSAAHRRSVAERLGKLATMIRERYALPEWQARAKQIAETIPQRMRTPIALLNGVYSFVNAAIRYTREEDGTDVFMTAENAIQRGYGDCDEQTQLVGILARALGFAVVVRAARMKNDRFTHVYPVVYAEGKPIAVDVTYQRGVGQEVPLLEAMDVSA